MELDKNFFFKKKRRNSNQFFNMDYQLNYSSEIQKNNKFTKEDNIISKKNHRIKHKQQSVDFDNIQHSRVEISRKLERETSKNIHLKDELTKIDSKIRMIELDRKVKENSKDELDLRRKLQTYEIKLKQIQLKNNGASAQIKYLQEEVNNARRERVIFDNVFKKLESDIMIKEEQLIQNIQQNLKIETQGQKIKNQLQKLKQQYLQEKQKFQEQYESIFQDSTSDLVSQASSISSQKIKIQIQQRNKSISKQFTSNNPSVHTKSTNYSGHVKDPLNFHINIVQMDQEQINFEKFQQMKELYDKIDKKMMITTGTNLEEFYQTFDQQEDLTKNLLNEYNTFQDEVITQFSTIIIKNKFPSMKIRLKKMIQSSLIKNPKNITKDYQNNKSFFYSGNYQKVAKRCRPFNQKNSKRLEST